MPLYLAGDVLHMTRVVNRATLIQSGFEIQHIRKETNVLYEISCCVT
jgi:hypothetical protein